MISKMSASGTATQRLAAAVLPWRTRNLEFRLRPRPATRSSYKLAYAHPSSLHQRPEQQPRSLGSRPSG